jgi:hypothetical protein
MAPAPDIQPPHRRLRPEHGRRLLRRRAASHHRHAHYLRRARRVLASQPQGPLRRRAHLSQGAYAPARRLGVPHQAVYPHHHIRVSQIHQPIGRPCHHYRGNDSEKGAWRLPFTDALRKLTGRLQKSSTRHDHGAREPDALVPLGVDHPVAVHGHQRPKEREDAMTKPGYRSQIVQRRVIEHNLYPTLHGFSISARYRGAGQLNCLWQLSGKRNATRESTAYRSIVIGCTADIHKVCSLLRFLVPSCFVPRLSIADGISLTPKAFPPQLYTRATLPQYIPR